MRWWRPDGGHGEWRRAVAAAWTDVVVAAVPRAAGVLRARIATGARPRVRAHGPGAGARRRAGDRAGEGSGLAVHSLPRADPAASVLRAPVVAGRGGRGGRGGWPAGAGGRARAGSGAGRARGPAWRAAALACVLICLGF